MTDALTGTPEQHAGEAIPTLDEGDLGRTIRELRKKKAFSLKDLAELSGVSVSFLSQVERGVTSPSISSLMRIAHSLDCTIGGLLESKAVSRLVRRGEGPRLVHSNRMWDEAKLTPREFTYLELIRSTLQGGGSTGDESIVYSSSETSMIVEIGQIEVDLNGEIFVLEPGDCLSFDSSVPHRFRNLLSEPSVILFASAPPSY